MGGEELTVSKILAHKVVEAGKLGQLVEILGLAAELSVAALVLTCNRKIR